MKVYEMHRDIKKVEYSVSKCKKDDTLYGNSHAAGNDKETLCGLKIDSNWYITGHTIHQTLQPITCKKCLKLV